jgi:hypothetical protein
MISNLRAQSSLATNFKSPKYMIDVEALLCEQTKAVQKLCMLPEIHPEEFVAGAGCFDLVRVTLSHALRNQHDYKMIVLREN